jgi:hypothetical protein
VAVLPPVVACMLLLGCGNPPTTPVPPAPPPAPSAPAVPVPGPRTDCRRPADVLDLRDWKLTLPIGTPSAPTHPEEIRQPDLAGFAVDPWFRQTGDCSGVSFRAAVNAPTTSGSKYPRSELREMTADGQNASWSSTVGTHTMVVDEAFTHLPQGKPLLVGAQIHDDSDDISVFRLEGSKLYVTDGDDPNAALVTDDYVLGTRFEAKFVVSGGVVRAFYDGRPVATLTTSFTDAYFKAGAYTQANCERVAPAPCSADNYGETTVYGLTVTHDPPSSVRVGGGDED